MPGFLFLNIFYTHATCLATLHLSCTFQNLLCSSSVSVYFKNKGYSNVRVHVALVAAIEHRTLHAFHYGIQMEIVFIV